MNGMQLILVFSLAAGTFLLVAVGLALGVLMGRKPIQGSCGGIANANGDCDNANPSPSCSLCSNPGRMCSQKPDASTATEL